MISFKKQSDTDESIFKVFNPLVKQWFKSKFETFSEPQKFGVLDIHNNKNTLISAPTGTGIIAGGPVRAVCEALGIQDVVAKSLGSANPHNVLKALIGGLKSQSSPKYLSALRGKTISEIIKRRELK